MAKLSPIGNNAQFINGIPANGAKLFFYAAGSSTKQTTYTDEGGLTAQSNPIILDARGEPAQPIWLTEGLSYKIVFAASTDSDPPVSPIWDVDDVTGINDASLTIDQWIDSGVVPTYVTPTQFTVPGDQTSAFAVGRALKSTVTAGTVYNTITNTAFTSLTTVTVAGGALDSGLSAVQYGIITSTNPSLPTIPTNVAIASASTVDLRAVKSSLIHITGTTTTSAVQLLNGQKITLIADAAWPLTYNATTNNITTGADYTLSVGDQVEYTYDGSVVRGVITKADGTAISQGSSVGASVSANALTVTYGALTITAPNGAELGTIDGLANRIYVVIINDSGTQRIGLYNTWDNANLALQGLIDGSSYTSLSIGTGSDSPHVLYAGGAYTGAVTVVGYVESTQAARGVWATSPSKVYTLKNGDFKTGDIVQKKFKTKTDTQTSSTTYTDVTNLNISLTPTSAANKVFYLCNLSVGITGGGAAIAKAVRDSTDLVVGDAAGTRIRASVGFNTLSSATLTTNAIALIDSPNSTSALNYKVQYQGFGGTTVYINRTPTDTDSTSFMRTASTLIVEEIFA